MKPEFIKIRKEQDKQIKACLEDINEYIYGIKNPKRQTLEETLLTLIYTRMQDLYFLIPKYLGIEEYNQVPLEHYIYQEDGKTLIKRIRRWIDEYNTRRDKRLFAYRNKLIAKHSLRYLAIQLCHDIIVEYHLYKWVTIDHGPYCEEGPCEDCAHELGTFLVENVNATTLPPFHPTCDCIAFYHDGRDWKNEVDDEDWHPSENDAEPDNDDLWEDE